MSGVENWFLIDVTSLEKKVARSSAVREVGEAGGEGQRREGKVAKRIRVLGELPIVSGSIWLWR